MIKHVDEDAAGRGGDKGAADAATSQGSGGKDGAGGLPSGTGGTAAGGGSTASGGRTSAGGTASDGGPASDGSAATYSDPCGTTEVPSNNDRDHATPYELSTKVRACLQSFSDYDMYEFAVPGSPSPGGVVLAKISDVDSSGDIELRFQAVSDNGTFGGGFADRGTNLAVWFAAKAGARFRLGVGAYIAANQTGYTMEMDYIPVSDPSEPNDTRATASALMVGTPVQGYFFSGVDSSTTSTGWNNWYKVTVPAGMATIALTDVPADIVGHVNILSSEGAFLDSAKSAAKGANATLLRAVDAGDYYVQLRPEDDPWTTGNGLTLPEHLTHTYTLTVTVK